MATKAKTNKLSATQVKDLESVNITATTVEEAREKMIAYLKSQDIDDVEEETYEELYDMVDAIYDDTDEALDAAAEEVEEDEEDEVDDSEEEDDDEEEEEDDEEEEDEEDDSEEEDDDEEDDLEEVAKAEEKANDKVAKKTEVKAKKTATKTAKEKGDKKASKRLNPIENKEDAAKYDMLKEVLGEDEFEFNFIANGGVSIKYLGKNSKKVFLSFDSPKVDKEGEIVGRVYLSSVKDEEVLQDLFGEDIETKKSWSGNILIIGMSITELVGALKSNKKAFDTVISNLTKKDEKLGKNREKMEADLKKENVEKAKTAKAKSAKK